jgi:bla regulator protein blaR1
MRVIELWVCEYLLNSLWQVPLLFGAAWVAARMVRNAGARVEHRIWVVALMLEAAVPALHLDLSELLRKAKSLLQWGGGGDAAGGHTRVFFGAGTGLSSGLLQLPGFVLTGVAAICLGCLVYFTGRLAWRVWKTVVMRRMAEPVRLTEDLVRAWEQLRGAFGLEEHADGEMLAVSPMISGPVTVGVARQVMLLPPEFLEGVSENEMEAVLAHEFAHMRRRDFAKNLMYEVLSLPVAYHPVLWLTRLRLAESREMVCDRMAADALRGRERYVRSLLRLASMLSDRPPTRILHAIGIFDANTFERRVMNLTKRSAEVRGVRRWAMVAACVAIGAATCVSALALRMGVAAGAGQDKTPTKLSVNASVMERNLISKKDPVYPAEAKANKDTIDGPVVLSVVISKEGIPERVFVKQSLRADYDRSAIEAVKEWQWKPFLLNGNPIEVKTTVTVNYTLAN